MITAFRLLILLCLTITVSVSRADIRPRIARIATKLEKGNKVHFGGPVGFSGKLETNNKYYRLYKRLNTRATNEELVELTNSKSAVIVVYAFNILYSRNYHALKNIFLNHIDDTTWYWGAGGCTGYINRVNWFMLSRLNPGNLYPVTNCFSKAEYDLYCQRFKEKDELYTCQ